MPDSSPKVVERCPSGHAAERLAGDLYGCFFCEAVYVHAAGEMLLEICPNISTLGMTIMRERRAAAASIPPAANELSPSWLSSPAAPPEASDPTDALLEGM